MYKKIAAIALAGTLGVTAFADSGVNVYVDGSKVDSEAVIINDRVYLPLRAVGEAMGAGVAWDDATRTVTVKSQEEQLCDVIADVSASVVAIVGNYKPSYMSQQAISYNEGYAHGTGVIIKNNGTILTNAHVVEGLENITVILGDGSSYAAEVKLSDETSDLAILRINKLGLRPIEFGSDDDIVVGRTVIAIGTPISLSLRNSATKGIISGKNVNIGGYYYLTQSDTAINGGNSGGPLITTDGKLIGINSSKYAGVGVEGMSFSIPVSTVNYVLRQYEQNLKVLRPELGLTLSESWEAKLGLPTQKGLTVKASTLAAIPVGSEIIAVNGIQVHSTADYNEALKSTYTSGDICITLSSSGTKSEVWVTPELK